MPSTLYTALQHHARAADRLMLWILWGLFGLGLALSSLHDTLQWALLIGLPTAGLPTALIVLRGGRRSTAMVVAAALMVFSALHIHQAAGMNEVHFGIFVLLAFLLCYRDALVVVAAAGVIALHHLSFNYLQELGYGVLCMSQPGIGRVLIHATYVIVETAVLCYLATLLRREAVQAAELGARVAAMSGGKEGTIDLRHGGVAANSPAGLALDAMMDRLHEAMSQVQNGVGAIAGASQEIAAGNQDLSKRTERQALSLQGTVATMDVLRRRVRESGEHARRANDLAINASGEALRGGEVVAQVVDTMASINASSKRIVDIIAVIDGIAFQTNILALNAAVEAARAGEQGRGFAVVADEVRVLSQRTHASTGEIQSMITSLQGTAQNAVSIMDDSRALATGSVANADNASRSLNNINEAVGVISSMASQIATAAEEQSQVVKEVLRNMTAIKRVADSSAEDAHQGEARAKVLQNHSTALKDKVSTFKL